MSGDLRAAAELVLKSSGDHNARTIAEHVLSSHRADDGEAVTEEWLEGIGFERDGHALIYDWVGYWNGTFYLGFALPGVRTRGDVRSLLRLLGVEWKEGGDV